MSFWISNPSMISSSGPAVCLFVCLFCSLPGYSSWTGWLHSRGYKKERAKKKVMVELLQTVREGGWGERHCVLIGACALRPSEVHSPQLREHLIAQRQ